MWMRYSVRLYPVEILVYAGLVGYPDTSFCSLLWNQFPSLVGILTVSPSFNNIQISFIRAPFVCSNLHSRLFKVLVQFSLFISLGWSWCSTSHSFTVINNIFCSSELAVCFTSSIYVLKTIYWFPWSLIWWLHRSARILLLILIHILPHPDSLTPRIFHLRWVLTCPMVWKTSSFSLYS